jgi:hypothetical protein
LTPNTGFHDLTPNPDHTAALVYDDGNDRKIFSKMIEFTDLPMGSNLLWCVASTILVPNEY